MGILNRTYPVIAVAGLVVATAPGVANFLPLFDPLLQGNKLGSGLVTILVPVILATIFLVAAVSAVRSKWEIS